MNNNILVLVKDINLYFFSSITACDCYAVLEEGEYGPWVAKIDCYDTVIFFDYGFTPEMASYLRSLSRARIVLFLWNHVDAEKLALLSKLYQKHLVDAVYTFDLLDAKKHHLHYNGTCYLPILDTKKKTLQNFTYDIFFGGSNQDREKRLQEMQKLCNVLQIHCHIFCPELDDKQEKQYVLYKEYLTMTLSSKAILEILKEGQTGISLRCMESMFYQKLLVTSNATICQYDFYNSNNIFILGVDPIQSLPSFLQNHYQTVDTSIQKFYHFDTWLQRILDYRL